MNSTISTIVAKVGGSLFDLPDLRERLRNWLANVCADRVILLPGGGDAANIVRQLDVTHQLGEESAHWLALRVLSVNAHFLGTLLDVPVVSSADRHVSHVGVLDAHEFCRIDENRPGALPHSWTVTSDSIAARVAWVTRADLALLKSTDLPANSSWTDAAASGLVDETFASIVADSGIGVTWINLRSPAYAGC